MDKEVDSELTTEREKIRENLSHMSFEELMKLKNKMGAKLYSETVFGESKRKKPEQSDYKRANKNRPREMSSKKPMRRKPEVIHVKKVEHRDPRFDPLCGTFNEHEFKRSYKFINNVKMNERKALKEELKNTEDPQRQENIKYLIQRLDNQLREVERKDKEQIKANEEKKEIKEKYKKGEKPEYKKKSEKKILNLLNQYEELKQNKKLKKHIESKSRKDTGKGFKKMINQFEKQSTTL